MPTLQKIMYVEDEPDIQTIASIALENIGGFSVKTCNCGADALEEAPEFAPDLILLDVMMPDMDGPTTLLEIRKIDSLVSTPVVFITAKAQLHEIAQYKSQPGVLDVITKPFDPITLSDTIRNIWENYHANV